MALLNLPDELLLDIVKRLGYSDLIRCMRVCKYLKAITQDRSLDSALFRGGKIIPVDDDFELDHIEMHPIFDSMSCTATEPEDCLVYTYDPNEFRCITDFPCRKEFATSPPMARIQFGILDFPIAGVKRKAGVTVLDLVGAICRFWDKRNKMGLLLSRTCPWHDLKPEEDRLAKYIELLGDRNGWTGFSSIDKDDNGCLLLEATYFDS